jgi:serine phosphatase RsbU (regulator of sigma subunit)
VPEARSSAVLDLQGNKLLAGLSLGEIEAAAPSFELSLYPADAEILAENQLADRVYLIAEGRAEVRKRIASPRGEDIRVGELGGGDFFGEMSFFAGGAEGSIRVRALSATRVYSLHRDVFMRLLTERPGIVQNILTNFLAQLHVSNESLLASLDRERSHLADQVAVRTRELEKLSSRISRELSVAQSIQKNLLPEPLITFPRVSIRTEYLPCDELSGDITGAFAIDEDHVGIYGGDVCGHGIHAAMIMSYVKKLVASSVKRLLLNRQYVMKPPGAVLSSINESFFAEISLGDPEIYLTLFFGVLNVRTLTLEYSSAGIHVPPLRSEGGRIVELFDRSDFPIGFVRGNEYETFRASLSLGDILLFASDGVVEAWHGGDVYGMGRLKAALAEMRDQPGGPDPAGIVASVRAHMAGDKAEDDMCLLLMTVG